MGAGNASSSGISNACPHTDLAAEGLGLKDATPYNVMFRGSAAVFLDVLSIERRRLGDPIWLPEAQFVRSFLLPLAVWRAFGVPPNQILLTHRDGLEPAEVYRWLPFWRKLSPSWLALASIPVWLGHLRRSNDSALYRSTLLSDNEQARFILTARLKSLQRRVASATPPDTSSMWADYAEGEKSYSRGQFSAKEDSVGGASESSARRACSMWDATMDTSVFSRRVIGPKLWP